MDDFEQLWNNYQAQIRSENGISEGMQKQFWDVVYPFILSDAKKIAKKYKGTSYNKLDVAKGIDPLELLSDGFENLRKRVQNNVNPLLFEKIDDFKGYMFTIMNYKCAPAKKKMNVSESGTEDDNVIFEYHKNHKDAKKKKPTYIEIDPNLNDYSINDDYNLGDSLNNIKEYGLEDVFNLFKESELKRELCHKLITLVVLKGIDYKTIMAENHFIGKSLTDLRKMKERCLKSLKVFINEHYKIQAL